MTTPCPLSARIRATADIDLYVSNNGCDANSHGQCYGTGGNGAFATPGFAVWWAAVNLDMAGYRLRILVDAGNYDSNGAPGNATPTAKCPNGACFGVFLYDVLGSNALWGFHPLVIQGASGGVAVTHPMNGPLLSFDMQGIVGIGTQSTWELSCLQLQSTIVDVNADRGTRINVNNIALGSFSGSPYPSPQKLMAIYGGNIELVGDVHVNAGGQYFAYASFQGGFIQVGGRTIWMHNNPGFSNGLTNYPDSSSYFPAPFNISGTWH